MEIHLSVGVSTLVALMAAHRADVGGDQMPHALLARRELAPIEADLDSGSLPALEPDHPLW
jgi:hypothetical protein